MFEFDACFDPKGDTTATGTVFESVLNVASTSLPRRLDGTVDVQSWSAARARMAVAAPSEFPSRFLPTLWKSPSHSSRRRASFRPSR